MILVVDNYDSFTFNLVQYLGELASDESIEIVRNDAISVDEVRELAPSRVVISPGPCTPNEAGVSLELISSCAGEFPILGVCLGHQAIGQAFGGRVVRAREAIHGKITPVIHDGEGLYSGIPQGFTATRYHSLIVEEESLPAELEVTARTPEGEIMGLKHSSIPGLIGVQYHPESILTLVGHDLLKNFLSFSI